MDPDDIRDIVEYINKDPVGQVPNSAKFVSQARGKIILPGTQSYHQSAKSQVNGSSEGQAQHLRSQDYTVETNNISNMIAQTVGNFQDDPDSFMKTLMKMYDVYLPTEEDRALESYLGPIPAENQNNISASYNDPVCMEQPMFGSSVSDSASPHSSTYTDIQVGDDDVTSNVRDSLSDSVTFSRSPSLRIRHLSESESCDSRFSVSRQRIEDQFGNEENGANLEIESYAGVSINECNAKRTVASRNAAGISLSNLMLQNDDDDTILHMALIEEDWYFVEALLKRYQREEKIDSIINVANKHRQTPLCLAVIYNQPEIVQQLVDLGAEVNNAYITQKMTDGKIGVKFDQPIHFAAGRGVKWLQTLKKLINTDEIDLNSFNSEGRTAMHCAVMAHKRNLKLPIPRRNDAIEIIDSKSVLAALVIAGADINLPDRSSGKTPLHYAIEKKDRGLVSALLGLAAQSPNQSNNSVSHLLNAKTDSGNFALHLAVSVIMDLKEQQKLIQMLLSRGADPSCKNSEGHLPREVSTNYNIVELLKGKGLGRSSSK
jgi:ankyrin repeat protein